MYNSKVWCERIQTASPTEVDEGQIIKFNAALDPLECTCMNFFSMQNLVEMKALLANLWGRVLTMRSRTLLSRQACKMGEKRLQEGKLRLRCFSLMGELRVGVIRN